MVAVMDGEYGCLILFWIFIICKKTVAQARVKNWNVFKFQETGYYLSIQSLLKGDHSTISTDNIPL